MPGSLYVRDVILYYCINLQDCADVMRITCCDTYNIAKLGNNSQGPPEEARNFRSMVESLGSTRNIIERHIRG